MLQTTVVGFVGNAAETKNQDGREFTTFRVAHNDDWTDANGTRHTNVIWVDCIMNGRPKVAEFIRQGTQVIVTGSTSVRTYSSQKDRCIKAGITINVSKVELLGGKTDEVPSRLYDSNGAEVQVTKHYWCQMTDCTLMTPRGAQFNVNDKGFITPIVEQAKEPDYGAGEDAKAFT